MRHTTSASLGEVPDLKDHFANKAPQTKAMVEMLEKLGVPPKAEQKGKGHVAEDHLREPFVCMHTAVSMRDSIYLRATPAL